MQITDIKVRKVTSDKAGNLKGEASVTISDDFAIHGIKIVEGKNQELFISMPSRKGKDKEGNEAYFDYAHPTTKEARKQLTDAILGAYKALA